MQKYIDDIKGEWQSQKQMIVDQLKVAEPMALSLRQPAATRYFSAGLLLLLEWCCYILAIGFIMLIFFTGKIYPLYLIPEMAAKLEVTNVMGQSNIDNLHLMMRGICVFIAFLLFVMGKNFNALRKKNTILNSAGKNIKVMVSGLLQRKAVMETLDQKHTIIVGHENDDISNEQPLPPASSGFQDIPLT